MSRGVHRTPYPMPEFYETNYQDSQRQKSWSGALKSPGQSTNLESKNTTDKIKPKTQDKKVIPLCRQAAGRWRHCVDVQKFSTLYVILSLRICMQIFVNTLTNKTNNLSVEPTEPLSTSWQRFSSRKTWRHLACPEDTEVYRLENSQDQIFWAFS